MTAQCLATPKEIEEIKFLKQNSPYSNTYNPGWKNHLNFAWKDQQQQAPDKAEWEVDIEKMSAHTSQFQEETRSNHRNTTAAIQNLEVQMGQIAQQVDLQVQGNQKSHENVNAVTTRSKFFSKEREEEVKFDDNLIEVDLEVRENKKKQEEVVIPVKPTEEKIKPKIRLSYPSRVEKKDTKEKEFDKFVKLFKKLEINIPSLKHSRKCLCLKNSRRRFYQKRGQQMMNR